MKTIEVAQDDFYTSSDLMMEVSGNEKLLVRVKVSDAWYAAHSAEIPNHKEVIVDGDNLVVIDGNI